MTTTLPLPAVELDTLVDRALVESRLESGLAPAAAVRRARLPGARAFAKHHRVLKTDRVWSEEENAFLRANLGRLSEDEIAARLGRTAVGVHIHWKRELRLTAPSNHPDVLTANQIANGMGTDLHIVASWIDRGILPGRRLPTNDVTRVVAKTTLLRWLVTPENWIYFRPERVGQENCQPQRGGQKYDPAFWAHAKRLLDLARRRWNDEWWTTRQVADYHHVIPSDVKRYIKLGRISAIRLVNRSGRHQSPHWANWFIRRSEAERLVFLRGKGAGHDAYWSPAESAFVVLAVAVGFSYTAIARLTGNHRPSEAFRLHIVRLHRTGAIPGLIRDYKLQIRYRARTGRLIADWKNYRHRFPTLANAMQKLRSGAALRRRELYLARGVLQAWAAWGGEVRLARSLISVGGRNAGHLREIVRPLRAKGLDPYRCISIEIGHKPKKNKKVN